MGNTTVEFGNCLHPLSQQVRSFVSNMREGSLPLETSFGFNAPLSHRSGDMKYSGDRKSICFKPFSVDYVKAIKNKAPGKVSLRCTWMHLSGEWYVVI